MLAHSTVLLSSVHVRMFAAQFMIQPAEGWQIKRLCGNMTRNGCLVLAHSARIGLMDFCCGMVSRVHIVCQKFLTRFWFCLLCIIGLCRVFETSTQNWEKYWFVDLCKFTPNHKKCFFCSYWPIHFCDPYRTSKLTNYSNFDFCFALYDIWNLKLLHMILKFTNYYN